MKTPRILLGAAALVIAAVTFSPFASAAPAPFPDRDQRQDVWVLNVHVDHPVTGDAPEDYVGHTVYPSEDECIDSVDDKALINALTELFYDIKAADDEAKVGIACVKVPATRSATPGI